MKEAIIIDSTFLINEKYKKENNIATVPLEINFENNSIKDEGDSEKLVNEIFSLINQTKQIPKTSQPTYQEFYNKYEEFINLGYTKIYSFYMSSKMSGTYGGSVNVIKDIQKQYPNIEILNFDTQHVGFSAMHLMKIIEVIKKNTQNKRTTSQNEIKNIIDYYNKNSQILFIVNDLSFLALGGRIKSSIASLANLLNIKPILTIQNGEIVQATKVRSTKRAYKKILEQFEIFLIKEKPNLLKLGFGNCLNKKESEILKKEIINCLNQYKVSYEIVLDEDLGPVIANHTGEKTLSVFWISEYNA